MRKITSRGSSLFLLELMISIVFFAIAAAGCVQVFAKAHTMSTRAEKLDQAVSIAQSLIEENSGETAESGLRYYDDQGNACGEGAAVYQAEAMVQTQDQMRQIRVVITDGAKHLIYQLETAVYCPGEADSQTGGGDE